MRRGSVDARFDVTYNNPLFGKRPNTSFPTHELFSLVNAVSGGTPSKGVDEYWSGDNPWISPKDFADLYIDDAEDHVSDTGIVKAGLTRIPKGTVLVVVRSGILRHTLPVTICSREAVINQDIKALLPRRSTGPNSPEIDPEYLAFYLHTFQTNILPIITKHSTTVQSVETAQFANLLIPLPPLSVQRELVAEMQAVRERRAQRLRDADAELSGMDAFLLDALGLTPPPADGRTVYAVRLKQLRSGGRLDALGNRPIYAQGYKPAVPMCSLRKLARIDANVVANPFDDNTLVPYVGLPECTQTEVREVVERPYREVKGRSVVRPSNILFARIEPSIFNQKYVLADNLHGFDFAYTSTEFYVVDPDVSLVNPSYLYSMFFCSFVFAQARGKTTGSSGRRRLDLTLFANLQIPFPERSIQDEIAVEVQGRRERARVLREEAAREWEAAKAAFERRLLIGKAQ